MPRPTNALIVDDEAHVRTFLRLLLNEAGIEDCLEATSGDAALAIVAQHRPGLVLLDLNLPGMGGLEILDKISKQHPETAVIIVTAQSTMHTVKEAVRLGAVGYILKHNPKAEALASLRELLDAMDDESEADASK